MSSKDKVTLIHQKLKKLGYEIKRTHCQEVLATIEDAKNWHVLKSKEKISLPKKEIQIYTTLCNHFLSTDDIDPINAMAILKIKDTESFYGFISELDQMLKNSNFNSLSLEIPKYIDYNLYDCYSDELMSNPNGIFQEEYSQDYKESQEFGSFEFKISKVLGEVNQGNELEFVFNDTDLFVVLSLPVQTLLDLLKNPNNPENYQYFCCNYYAGRKDSGSYFIVIKNPIGNLDEDIDFDQILELGVISGQIPQSDVPYITDIQKISKADYDITLPDKK